MNANNLFMGCYYNVRYMNMYSYKPSRYKQDVTQGKFIKQSTGGFNSEFSFS